MPETKRMAIRLAFREEGEFWNCYLALPDSMTDAKLLGTILMGAVRQHPEVKRTFMEAMKLALANAAEDVTGKRPDEFIEERAPEGERSGHA